MARSRIKPLRRSPLRAAAEKHKPSPFRGGLGGFFGSETGQTAMRGDVLNLTGWKNFTPKKDEGQGKIDDAFLKFQDLGGEASKNMAEGISMGTQKVNNAFGGLGKDFKNTYKDIKNPYAEIDETNFAEDLTVNTQAANFEKDMAQQSQANVMQGMQGAAGGSGIAGLAQAMANQGAQSARRIAGGLGQQE